MITTRLLIPPLMLAAVPQMDTMYAGDAAAALLHDVASGSTWLALFVHVLFAEWYVLRRRATSRP